MLSTSALQLQLSAHNDNIFWSTQLVSRIHNKNSRALWAETAGAFLYLRVDACASHVHFILVTLVRPSLGMLAPRIPRPLRLLSFILHLFFSFWPRSGVGLSFLHLFFFCFASLPFLVTTSQFRGFVLSLKHSAMNGRTTPSKTQVL